MSLKLWNQEVLRGVALAGLVYGLFGCAEPRYAFHSTFELKGCKTVPPRNELVRELVKKGFLHASEPKGPYDIFHRPSIVKKSVIAAEPYADMAGDIAVATCPAVPNAYLISEEWVSCKDRKDCTEVDQGELRGLAESWGCQVGVKSGHSKSWKLEEHQDWTKDTCSTIVNQLVF